MLVFSCMHVYLVYSAAFAPPPLGYNGVVQRPLRIAQLCIAFRITPLLWVVYCVLRICIAYLP